MLYISHIIYYLCQELKTITSGICVNFLIKQYEELKDKSDELGIPIALSCKNGS